MKRFYMLILGIIYGIGSTLYAADEKITIFELNTAFPDADYPPTPFPNPSAINGNYTYGTSGEYLTVTSRGIEVTDGGSDADLQFVQNNCFDGETSFRFAYVFKGNPSSTSASPYIAIQNMGSKKITKIEVIGVGTESGTILPVEGSSSNNPSDADYESSLFLAGMFDFSFKQTGETVVCDYPSAGGTLNVASAWDETKSYYQMMGMESSIGAYPQTFRLHFTTVLQAPSGRKPKLQALYVYVEDKETSIESIESDFGLRIAGDVLEASQLSDVTIYSLNGIPVKSAKGITSLPVSDLQQGIYLVKALSANGQSKAIKMVR